MTQIKAISDYVSVPRHPTVVQLDDLDSDQSQWIRDSFFITEDIQKHRHALAVALSKSTGVGIFLIGHYGSGKSHFLAYIIQEHRHKKQTKNHQKIHYLSLVNYGADQSLESIVNRRLNIQDASSGDRRDGFAALQQRFPQGVLLVLDELSEFLRSKPNPASFSEDIRFLQFMGEWAKGHRFWIMAAMQEQIEHTGHLDGALYRKIKDRFPIRFLLTPVHVKDLVAKTLLLRKDGFDQAVSELTDDFALGFVRCPIDEKTLKLLYPIHPMSLQLLEEVRDSFSHARGIVDFVVTQLLGNEERQIQPFLNRPWGSLVTPDYIVDHFKDLFEIQPEFLPLSNQCLAWYRQHLDKIFTGQNEIKLAKQVIKLLMLVYISPTREGLTVEQAVDWLMFRATRLDVKKNQQVLGNVLNQLIEKGRFVERHGETFSLNLKHDSHTEIAQHLNRIKLEFDGKTEQVFDSLCNMLADKEFNPNQLSRSEWQSRVYSWHFHDRNYRVILNQDAELEPSYEGLSLHISLPWLVGSKSHSPAILRPAEMSLSPQYVELAAMIRMIRLPLSSPSKVILKKRINDGTQLFYAELKQAFHQSRLYVHGKPVNQFLNIDTSKPFISMVELCIDYLLKKKYPSFERFCPSYGPLPKKSWESYLNAELTHHSLALESDGALDLIQVAYLEPMNLIRRKERNFVIHKQLNKHELVSILLGMLEHEPSPKVVYKHFAEPVFGLVDDQIHCLLYFLLAQGEIDIVKDHHSLRDHYETLLDPRHYDRVVAAQALTKNEISSLEILLSGLKIKIPKQWTVSAQRNALEQVHNAGQHNRQQLHSLALKLPESERGLKQKLASMIDLWTIFTGQGSVFQLWQQFLYEVDSLSSFIQNHDKWSTLPASINHYLSQIGRFNHIKNLADQWVSSSLDPPNIETPPAIDEIHEFDHWLLTTSRHYQDYCEDYAQKHDKYWSALNPDDLLSWRAESISRSRHLGLSAKIADFQRLQIATNNQVCPAVDSLEFQPLCHCGFDGKQASIAKSLDSLQQLKQTIEQETLQFFKQSKVKQRVAQWLDDGLECNQLTQDYVAGKVPTPEIKELDLFDNFLSGVQVTQIIDANELISRFCADQWEPKQLADALHAWAMGYQKFAGVRIIQTDDVIKDELLSWVANHVLQTGCPLPKGLSEQQHQLICESLNVDLVSNHVWCNLDEIGFNQESLMRLLKMIVSDDLIKDRLREQQLSPSAAIAIQLDQPLYASDFHELARMANQHYSYHHLFEKFVKQPWLHQLEQLATIDMTQKLMSVEDYLSQAQPGLWLVLDAFGLALLDEIKVQLNEWFPLMEIDKIDFMLASTITTTDEFYRAVLSSKHDSGFTKINCIDDLLHQGLMDFDDFKKKIIVDLGIALKNKLTDLQSGSRLMISGDHGFRLSKDGKRFEHGGSSMLERVVPVICLIRL